MANALQSGGTNHAGGQKLTEIRRFSQIAVSQYLNKPKQRVPTLPFDATNQDAAPLIGSLGPYSGHLLVLGLALAVFLLYRYAGPSSRTRRSRERN
jgi:hypothetical protein